MRAEASIFKAYDIRGIYPEQIDGEGAHAIGKAFATFLLKKETNKKLYLAVGSDVRLSSPELKKNLIEGLLESGIDVDDIGAASTPTFYFAVGNGGYDGGVQVSASHNPKEWNGFKLVGPNASPISKESGIDDVRSIIGSGSFVESSSRGTLKQISDVTQQACREQMPSDHGTVRPFTIAIDTANGMGALDMKELFKQLPCSVVWMNEKLDGTFPAHPADPMVAENNVALQKKIVEVHCDLGIASDGDGDRYFFFDEHGTLVPPEIVRGIMAQRSLAQHSGATVVYDVRPGKITRDMIDEVGGRSVVAPVGHSLIKDVMLKHDAVFGGESSGHFFYKLPYGTFEAPFVLVCEFLAFLSESNTSLSKAVAPYKRYVNSGEINTHLASREAGLSKIEDIKQRWKDFPQETMDGLFVECPDYSFLLRLSNTEPLIRLIVESKDRTIVEQKVAEITNLLRA